MLKEFFKKCPFPSTETKKVIAEQLGLSEERVITWFNNHRKKEQLGEKYTTKYNGEHWLIFNSTLVSSLKWTSQ